MTLARVLLPAVGLALGTMVPAQDPVPTRILTNTLGTASGTPLPSGLVLGVHGEAAMGTAILMCGGKVGALAVLALGVEPTKVLLPFDATLLVQPLVTVGGVFDHNGDFALPVPLDKPVFVGREVLAQGLHIALAADEPIIEAFQATAALRLAYLPGNKQPPLTYVGPPLVTTFVAADPKLLEGTFHVMTTVVVPTTGWDLRLLSLHDGGAVTTAYYVLEEPGPYETVAPMLETKRVWVNLGHTVGAELRIMVQRQVRGVLPQPFFALAASIETAL